MTATPVSENSPKRVPCPLEFAFDPHFQIFTYEVEQEGAIFFFWIQKAPDRQTDRQTEVLIIVSVHLKPTNNADNYLDFDSHHHVQHKRQISANPIYVIIERACERER